MRGLGKTACRIGLVVLVLALGETAQAAGVFVSSTFDTDFDGWTGEGGCYTYQTTGGNPGGYMQFSDCSSTGYISAPAKFLGNWQPYVGSTLVSPRGRRPSRRMCSSTAVVVP